MSFQESPEVYFRQGYDTKKRFCSYWHQINEILSLKPTKALEVGVGSGFVSRYLKEKDVDLVTVDTEQVLEPDVRADIRQLPFNDSSFDVVACFEVLEHLPYEDFLQSLSELYRVSSSHVVLSLPDAERYFRYFFELPFLSRAIQGMIVIPRVHTHKHRFDGYHYWEIAKAGYPLKKIIQQIEDTGFSIEKNYRVFEMPGHRFFVLRK